MLAEIAPWETFAGMAVTAGFAGLVAIWQGRKTRTVNTDEHKGNERHLLRLHAKVDDVRGAVDDLTTSVEEHGKRLEALDGLNTKENE